MKPQHVSNMLWALSQVALRPEQLTGLLAEAAGLQAPGMIPQHTSNSALGLAKLGMQDGGVFAALFSAAHRQVVRCKAQELCNLCWAAKVADQGQLAGPVGALCRHLARTAWLGTVAEERQQLHQVHLWLLDRAPAGGVLSGALSADQVVQCAAAWRQQQEQRVQQPRNRFELAVFRCVQRLPRLTGCAEQQPTPDGAFAVDVAATHAARGRLVAVEADGPSHFLSPGRQPRGDTLAWHRALAARGYVVVSVPYWEWNAVQGDPRREVAYLAARVEAAVLEAAGPGLPAAAAE